MAEGRRVDENRRSRHFVSFIRLLVALLSMAGLQNKFSTHLWFVIVPVFLVPSESIEYGERSIVAWIQSALLFHINCVRPTSRI